LLWGEKVRNSQTSPHQRVQAGRESEKQTNFTLLGEAGGARK